MKESTPENNNVRDRSPSPTPQNACGMARLKPSCVLLCAMQQQAHLVGQRIVICNLQSSIRSPCMVNSPCATPGCATPGCATPWVVLHKTCQYLVEVHCLLQNVEGRIKASKFPQANIFTSLVIGQHSPWLCASPAQSEGCLPDYELSQAPLGLSPAEFGAFELSHAAEPSLACGEYPLFE